MSFSKAPIRRFNELASGSNNNKQKVKVQKSQSSIQKKIVPSPRILKASKEPSDLQPVEVEQSVPSQEYKSEFVINIDKKLQELCEVGDDAINSRESLVSWLLRLKKKYSIGTGDVEALDQYIQQGEELKFRWEEANKEQAVMMKQLMNMCRQVEEVNTLNKLKDALEEKLSQSNKRIKDLEARLNVEEKKMKELMHQNKNIEKHIQLKEQYNDLKLMETQKSLELYSKKSQSQLEGLEQRISELREVLNQKDSIIEDLKEQLRTSQGEQASRMKAEMDKTADEAVKLSEAQKQLAKKEEQIQTLTQDLCNLKQLLRRSEEQISALSSQLRNLYNSGPDQQVLSLRKQISPEKIKKCGGTQRSTYIRHIPLTELCYIISGIVI